MGLDHPDGPVHVGGLPVRVGGDAPHGLHPVRLEVGLVDDLGGLWVGGWLGGW